MAVSYSYDTIYKIYAYRENAVRIVATQGEGFAGAISSLGNNDLVKSPQFQLRDDRGVVVIPASGSPRVELAIVKSNGTEDLLDCSIIDRSTGVIACPIRKSLTDVPGIVKGEIRLITTNAVTKFYGINFFIHDGVSDNAAAQSSRFSDLIAALQQVGLIIEGGSEGTVSLDTVIQANGTKPVASGIIYNYLASNYVKYVTVSDATIDDAVELNTLYYGHINGMYSEIECVVGTSWKTQFLHRSNGVIQMRTKHKTNDAWGDWGDWSPIGTTTNIDDSAITTAKISNGAVTTLKLDDNSVTDDKLSQELRNKTSLLPENKYVLFINELGNVSSLSTFDLPTYCKHGSVSHFYAQSPLSTTLGIRSGAACELQYIDFGTYNVGYQIITAFEEQKIFYRIINSSVEPFSGGNWTESLIKTSSIDDGAITQNKIASSVYESTPTNGSSKLITSGGVYNALNNQIVVFSYTLTSSGWNSNNEQTVTKPSSYVVTSDVIADTEIDSTTFYQLCADGCGGIYISSERSGSTLTLTAHALNNKPTANVTVQVTLTKVSDLSE